MILKVMREHDEGEITYANTVTADTCSLVFSSQTDNLNTIVASEKIEKADKLVYKVNNTTINEVRYELSIVTASDALLLTLATELLTKKY